MNSSAKKDRLGLVKSRWERSEIYRFSRFLTLNFLRQPNIVAGIFEDIEPPSKNFIATTLKVILANNKKHVRKLCL